MSFFGSIFGTAKPAAAAQQAAPPQQAVAPQDVATTLRNLDRSIGIKQQQRISPAAPESSVAFEGAKAYVLVLTPDGDGGLVVKRRDIEVGTRQGGFVEVVGGLNPGERVMAEGLNRVQPNARVTIAGQGGQGSGGGQRRRRQR